MGDDRRVTRAAYLVALRGQVAPQLVEVVELAVEDGDDVAGLVCDRLAARGEVDHLETAVPQHAAAEGVDRALVGPAVDERGVHRLDQRRVGRAGMR